MASLGSKTSRGEKAVYAFAFFASINTVVAMRDFVIAHHSYTPASVSEMASDWWTHKVVGEAEEIVTRKCQKFQISNVELCGKAASSQEPQPRSLTGYVVPLVYLDGRRVLHTAVELAVAPGTLIGRALGMWTKRPERKPAPREMHAGL
jgi:hypothetical protein